jgi:hypothetical protein
MARAGERDDRDAHEGLLAWILRAPLASRVALQADLQILLRASRIRTSTWCRSACIWLARANGMIETLTKVFSLRCRTRAARLSCRAAG